MKSWRWDKQKILIVEDDIDIQDILKNHLIDAGYEVAVASDGVAGIAMFDDTIDLVLLDIMLPKIDGYGVCEVIRKRSQVPIIMLTAKAMRQVSLMALTVEQMSIFQSLSALKFLQQELMRLSEGLIV